MKFKLKDGDFVRTVKVTKESATVIEAGDLVAMSAGYAIKAVAASTAIGWTPTGAIAGETWVEVSVGNDFTLEGTGDVVFAITYKGGEYDINDTTQTVDYGASSTDVFKVGIGMDTGVVGTAAGVEVRINKPLF